MQEMTVGRHDADHRAQEFRIGRNQRRRQETFGDQPVGAVNVGGDVLKQFGGAQFSAFKPALADLLVAKLSPITAEMRRLNADHAYIDQVLADGSQRARVLAGETMRAVKDIVGFVRS